MNNPTTRRNILKALSALGAAAFARFISLVPEAQGLSPSGVGELDKPVKVTNPDVIKELQTWKPVKSVPSQLGTPDWSNAYRYVEPKHAAGLFVIPLTGSTDVTLKQPYLIVRDSSVESERAISIFVDAHFVSQEEAVITYADSAGMFLGQVKIDKSGKVTKLAQSSGKLAKLAERQLDDYVDVNCFLSCVGFAAVCLDGLLCCAAVPIPANPCCIFLVACAGGAAIFCAAICYRP